MDMRHKFDESIDLHLGLAVLPQDGEAVDPGKLAYGMKQAEAARIRVKYLTAWNRQKIDRLAELRGQSSPHTYTDRLR
jgi:hypothetical protein